MEDLAREHGQGRKTNGASPQRLVAYERVSTARQEARGLGLEAQRKVIEDFVASRGAEVLARFTEVESGRKADRPELARRCTWQRLPGLLWLSQSWTGSRAMQCSSWRCGTAGCSL